MPDRWGELQGRAVEHYGRARGLASRLTPGGRRAIHIDDLISTLRYRPLEQQGPSPDGPRPVGERGPPQRQFVPDLWHSVPVPFSLRNSSVYSSPASIHHVTDQPFSAAGFPVVPWWGKSSFRLGFQLSALAQSDLFVLWVTTPVSLGTPGVAHFTPK